MVSLIVYIFFSIMMVAASRWIIALLVQVVIALFQLVANLIGAIMLVGFVAWVLFAMLGR